MIEIVVKVYPSEGSTMERTLATIRIENTMEGDPEVGSYRADIAVDNGDSLSSLQRYISGFPRTKFNVLGLMKLVLNQLSEEDLYLDRSSAPADMAWRQHPARSAIQSLFGKLHNH